MALLTRHVSTPTIPSFIQSSPERCAGHAEIAEAWFWKQCAVQLMKRRLLADVQRTEDQESHARLKEEHHEALRFEVQQEELLMEQEHTKAALQVQVEDVNRVAEALGDAVDEARRLEQSAVTERQRAGALRCQLQESEQLECDLEAEVSAMHAEVQHHARQAAEVRSESISLRAQLDKALVEQQRLYEECAAQRTERQGLEEAFEYEVRRGENAQRNVDDLSQKLQELHVRMDADVREIENEFAERLNIARRREEALEAVVQKLHADIQLARAKLDSGRAELVECGKVIDSSKSAIADLSSRVQRNNTLLAQKQRQLEIQKRKAELASRELDRGQDKAISSFLCKFDVAPVLLVVFRRLLSEIYGSVDAALQPLLGQTVTRSLLAEVCANLQLEASDLISHVLVAVLGGPLQGSQVLGSLKHVPPGCGTRHLWDRESCRELATGLPLTSSRPQSAQSVSMMLASQRGVSAGSEGEGDFTCRSLTPPYSPITPPTPETARSGARPVNAATRLVPLSS